MGQSWTQILIIIVLILGPPSVLEPLDHLEILENSWNWNQVCLQPHYNFWEYVWVYILLYLNFFISQKWTQHQIKFVCESTTNMYFVYFSHFIFCDEFHQFECALHVTKSKVSQNWTFESASNFAFALGLFVCMFVYPNLPVFTD